MIVTKPEVKKQNDTNFQDGNTLILVLNQLCIVNCLKQGYYIYKNLVCIRMWITYLYQMLPFEGKTLWRLKLFGRF